MYGTMLGAALLLAAPVDDLTLRATTSEGDTVLYEFTSTPKTERAWLVITDRVANHRTERPFKFELDSDVKGVLAAATNKGKETTAASITMMRTTYRSHRERTGGVTIRETNGDEESVFSANRWAESDLKAKAYPGHTLEAMLIDGGPTGTVLVRCSSDVSGDAEKGYTYTWNVENRTAAAVKVKWAGVEGTVEPKKTLTKTTTAKDLTLEQSEIAAVELADKRAYTFRANVWAAPK